MKQFSEATRVQMPAMVHLTRIGYTYFGKLNEEKMARSMTVTYNLDVIIAVGYRVNSARATKFRQWATKILNEYIRKGFVLDDERLKQGTAVFTALLADAECLFAHTNDICIA